MKNTEITRITRRLQKLQELHEGPQKLQNTEIREYRNIQNTEIIYKNYMKMQSDNKNYVGNYRNKSEISEFSQIINTVHHKNDDDQQLNQRLTQVEITASYIYEGG